MSILRYDVITAIKSGETKVPSFVMDRLKYKVLKSETVPIAGAVFFEVEKINEPLPPYLTKSNFQFSIQIG